MLGILLARKYPGSRGLVAAKDYELLKNTTLVSYMEHLQNMGYKEGVHFKYNKTDKIIKFQNGSEILFKGIDDPERIKSLNIHWAEIEEVSQISYTAFNVVLSRLRASVKSSWRGFVYRLFMHTNPQANKGWIHKAFVENPQENYRRIIAPTSNNTHLPEHFLETLKRNFDEEYFKINVLGQDGDYSSGLVVKGYSDDNKKDFVYNKNLALHLTCDFNVDPMCWLLFFKDKRNICYFDEIVVENTTTQQTVEEFLRRYPDHKAQIVINGDSSGDNRSCNSEFTNYAIIRKALKEHGYKDVVFHLRPYNPPILSRVSAFNAKIRNAVGDVSLFLDPRKCKWLEYNMNNLKFKEGTSIIDVPTHYQIKKEHSLKFLSHIYDAASYPVEYYWAIR